MSVADFQALGFTAFVDSDQRVPANSFFKTWLYRHDLTAQDGSCLFLALPFGIPRWRLSTLPWPLAPADIVQDLAPQDLAGLKNAVEQFFAAHGGRGAAVKAAPRWRPQGFPHEATR